MYVRVCVCKYMHTSLGYTDIYMCKHSYLQGAHIHAYVCMCIYTNTKNISLCVYIYIYIDVQKAQIDWLRAWGCSSYSVEAELCLSGKASQQSYRMPGAVPTRTS